MVLYIRPRYTKMKRVWHFFLCNKSKDRNRGWSLALCHQTSMKHFFFFLEKKSVCGLYPLNADQVMKAMKRASFNFLSGVGYSFIAVVDRSNIRTLSSLNRYCLGILFLCCFTPCVITDFITYPFITSYQDLSLAYTRNGAYTPSTTLLEGQVR